MPKKRSRAPQGTGSLDERPPGSGHWRLRYATKDLGLGKRRRRSLTFESAPRNVTEARKRAQELLQQAGEAKTEITLGSLIERFLEGANVRGLSPETLQEYRRMARSRVIPALGGIRLSELSAQHLDAFYAECMSGARPVGPASVRRFHNLISVSLNQAFKWGWIEGNVAQRATVPKVPVERVVAPSPDEVRRILDGARNGVGAFPPHPVLAKLIELAIGTGARRGELCGLTWDDVGEDRLYVGRSVFVVAGRLGTKPPKSNRFRYVWLSPTMSATLARWHAEALAVATEHGVELVDGAYVLSPQVDGHLPFNPDTGSAAFRRLCDELMLPKVHLHSLRHFAATQLLLGGVSPRDVADMLGHADPSITLRVYAHSTPSEQQRAAWVLEQTLLGTHETP